MKLRELSFCFCAFVIKAMIKSSLVAKIHTGKLRQYTIHVIIAALVIFFFLART